MKKYETKHDDINIQILIESKIQKILYIIVATLIVSVFISLLPLIGILKLNDFLLFLLINFANTINTFCVYFISVLILKKRKHEKIRAISHSIIGVIIGLLQVIITTIFCKTSLNVWLIIVALVICGIDLIVVGFGIFLLYCGLDDLFKMFHLSTAFDYNLAKFNRVKQLYNVAICEYNTMYKDIGELCVIWKLDKPKQKIINQYNRNIKLPKSLLHIGCFKFFYNAEVLKEMKKSIGILIEEINEVEYQMSCINRIKECKQRLLEKTKMLIKLGSCLSPVHKESFEQKLSFAYDDLVFYLRIEKKLRTN